MGFHLSKKKKKSLYFKLISVQTLTFHSSDLVNDLTINLTI